MTEPDWLTAKAGDRMLEFVADRLAARQWRFLACGLVRKAADLLPAGPLLDVVDWVETHPDEEPKAKARAEWARKLEPAAAAAAGYGAAEMRTVVKAADPDAGDQPPGSAPDPDDLPPSRVLFDAASRHAARAVDAFGSAAEAAAKAAGLVLQAANEEGFEPLHGHVRDALARKAAANQAAANALKLKQLGDEFADNYNVRTERLDRSKASAHVTRIEEAAAEADTEGKAERVVRRHLARLLHEVVGNPFNPAKLDPAWRTSAAAALAEGIFADRAFDRLPVLADALLDADCDEEAVLRHCRGTERHLDANESAVHVRGCWVVESVLGRWQPLKPAKPAAKAKKKKAPDWLDLMFDEPGLRDDDKLA